MTLVEGDFCPRVEQRCLRWLDPPGKFHEYRCAEYARPARCLAPRVHERFCIDRHERTAAGEALPLNMQSWTDAKKSCEAAGARVCMDSEWTFACEGRADAAPPVRAGARAADKARRSLDCAPRLQARGGRRHACSTSALPWGRTRIARVPSECSTWPATSPNGSASTGTRLALSSFRRATGGSRVSKRVVTARPGTTASTREPKRDLLRHVPPGANVDEGTTAPE